MDNCKQFIDHRYHLYLITTTIFHHIPSYSIIFHHIPSYSIIFHHIPSYSIIFHHIPSYSIIFRHIPSYSIIFHHIPSYSIIFHHIPSYSIIFHHIPSYSIIFHLYLLNWSTSNTSGQPPPFPHPGVRRPFPASQLCAAPWKPPRGLALENVGHLVVKWMRWVYI